MKFEYPSGIDVQKSQTLSINIHIIVCIFNIFVKNFNINIIRSLF